MFIGIINFNGPDDNFTMSNMDDSLYLRACPQQQDVVSRDQPNVSYWLAKPFNVSCNLSKVLSK